MNGDFRLAFVMAVDSGRVVDYILMKMADFWRVIFVNGAKRQTRKSLAPKSVRVVVVSKDANHPRSV